MNQQDVIILAMNPVQEHAKEPAKADVKTVAQVHAGINAKIRVMGIAKTVVLPPAKTLVYTRHQANLPINLHPITISQVAMIVLVDAKTVAVLDAEPLAQEDAVIIAPEIVKPTVQITVLLRVKVLARQAAQEIVKERVKTHVWKPAKARAFSAAKTDAIFPAKRHVLVRVCFPVIRPVQDTLIIIKCLNI